MGFSPALSNQITNFPLKMSFVILMTMKREANIVCFFSLSLSLSFAFLVASNVTKYLLWCTGLLSDEKMCSLVSHYHFSWVWCQLTLIFALISPSIFQGNKAKIQDLLLCFSLLECMFPSWTAVKGSRVLHSQMSMGKVDGWNTCWELCSDSGHCFI